jgi:hypothetical protein
MEPFAIVEGLDVVKDLGSGLANGAETGVRDQFGLQRWRQQLRQANRDKLIIFIANRYAIYDTHEFLVLTRVLVSRIPP